MSHTHDIIKFPMHTRAFRTYTVCLMCFFLLEEVHIRIIKDLN